MRVLDLAAQEVALVDINLFFFATIYTCRSTSMLVVAIQLILVDWRKGPYIFYSSGLPSYLVRVFFSFIFFLLE